MIKNWIFLTLALALTDCANETRLQYFDIRNFGAVGDGKTLCTDAFAKAVEAASKVGGVVYVPEDTFLTGTIFLKSNVTLEISTKGVIKGSPDSKDYKLVDKAANPKRKVHHLIYAKGQENITIQGRGTIDGNCYAFWQEYDTLPRWIHHKVDSAGRRLYSNLVELVDVKNLVIRDVLMKDSPEWTCHLFDCTDVLIDGLRIRNNLFGPNADGLDMSGVQNVIVQNCNIKTCDDGICLKTFPHSRETRNVTVSNCIIETSCAAFKFGETYRRISDVTFSNSVIKNSSRAIGIYATMGGDLENLTVNNIVCNTNAPLVLNRPIQIGAWNKKDTDGNLVAKGGNIRNFTISNFTTTTGGRILITADDGLEIDGLTLRNIKMKYPWIEDPYQVAVEATSNQFNGIDTTIRRQRAAMIVHGVSNFELDGFYVDWPEQDTVPEAWQHPERIENGSERVHRYDYQSARPAPFHALLLSNTVGYVRAPLLRGSETEKAIIKMNQVDLIK